MPDHAWMLECAQGNIIGTFPFGLIAPTRYFTLDYDSAWWTIRDFARLFIKELMQPRQS